MTVKLLFLSGSSRKESLNKKLARNACDTAKELGADVTYIDLADYDLPIYNGDFEDKSGVPENAVKLKKLFFECDGFLISSPEYNSSFSPLLKNTIDWMSRTHEEGEKPLIAFKGKVAALISASPGSLGGLRGLVPLRMLLGNIGITVIPDQLAVSKAHEVFDHQDKFKDEKQFNNLKKVVSALIDTTKALKK